MTNPLPLESSFDLEGAKIMAKIVELFPGGISKFNLEYLWTLVMALRKDPDLDLTN